MFAVKVGHIEPVKTLIAAGADVSLKVSNLLFSMIRDYHYYNLSHIHTGRKFLLHTIMFTYHLTMCCFTTIRTFIYTLFVLICNKIECKLYLLIFALIFPLSHCLLEWKDCSDDGCQKWPQSNSQGIDCSWCRCQFGSNYLFSVLFIVIFVVMIAFNTYRM